MPDQGLFSYPGLEVWEGVDFTDVAGISPSVCTVSVYPQFGYPAADGDIVFTYGSQVIRIRNCHVDAARYLQNESGQVVQVTIMDERWRWKFYRINGRYNFKNVKAYDAAFPAGSAVGFVDPDHEKTPQELAELLIKAMGYAATDWDLSALPDDARPEVNWIAANPAQELDNLVNSFGCRIVPVRSAGIWKIAVTGDGNDLPDNLPYTPDSSEGFDPAEIPNWIQIVTAPTLYECRIPLTAVGKDIDGIWKTIDELSYNPLGGYDGFVDTDRLFFAIDNTRIYQADGSLVSPRELALQTVFRNYVMERDDVVIPGISDPVYIDRIIISDNMVRPWIDPNTQSVQTRQAYIEGTFWTPIKGVTGNWPLGTRIDRPAMLYGSPAFVDEVVSFGVTVNEDARWSMVTLSDQVTKYIENGGSAGDTYTAVPDLFLHCAAQIRDEKSWTSIRETVSRWIGTGPQVGSPDDDDAFVWSIIKDDIQPFYRGIYATGRARAGTVDNIDAVRREANYYIDSLIKTLEVRQNLTRSAIGLFPIDMDGRIQQVTYHIGMDGATTIASEYTEHDYELPSYDNQRERNARKNLGNKQAVEREIMDNLRKAGLAAGL